MGTKQGEADVADLSQFLGPLGGLLAGTWGGGAVMGYTFAHRTLSKRISEMKDEMREDKADCDRRINDITTRLREVENRSFWGVRHQSDQQRESAIHLIDKGIITPVGDGK